MVNWAPADFWKYWAIAIPLTVTVMGIWATYMITVDRWNSKRLEDALGKFRMKLGAQA